MAGRSAFASTARTKRRLRWWWVRSWIVTVPIVIIFAVWIRGTYSRWHAFALVRTTAHELDLRSIGGQELAHMARSARVALTQTRTHERLAATGFETIHLYLPEARLQRLDAALPHSGREYVEGGMLYEGRVHEVDLRYRGDNVYHWGYWKKSWRVKTKRDALYKGMRRFNLIAPRTAETLNNYLAYRLAAELEVVAPYSELVNVALNGELIGLYVLTEQLDESTIRRHALMPGDVYSGELVGADSLVGTRNLVFDHPGAWTKVAVNNHFDAEARAPLDALTDAVGHASSDESARRLGELIDVDAFGRFSAFEALVCTTHVDSNHNWRLYYDPWRTRFVPIAWDPFGWHATIIPRPATPLRPDVISSSLHVALFERADFLRARVSAFDEFFGEGRDEAFLAHARDVVARIRPALDLDPNMMADSTVVGPATVERSMEQLIETIADLFEQLRDVYSAVPEGGLRYRFDAEGALQLEVDGRRPIEELELVFDRRVEGPLEASFEWQTVRGAERADRSADARVAVDSLRVSCGLLANHRISLTSLQPQECWVNRIITEPARYRLEVSGPDGWPGVVRSIRYRLHGSANWRVAPEVEALQAVKAPRTRGLVEDAPVLAPVVWSGAQRLSGDLVLARDLVIEPGTVVSLEPGANLLVYGRVSALGTETAPITFAPADPDLGPWGVIAIKGARANGSRFEHCNFSGGSGWKLPLAEYCAMLSIHDTRDVVVSDCAFADNHVVDDMVHGVYSEVRFIRSEFERSLFDALDMDISKVELVDCTFSDSGNDAIDLMTSDATILGSRFVNSGDKGISVGELSQLTAVDSLLIGCAIGVQSKDESDALLVNCDLIDCQQAVDAYRKNWRYDGGGRALVTKSRISGCGSVVTADRHSRVALSDSYVDRLPDERAGRIDLSETVDSTSRLGAARPDWSDPRATSEDGDGSRRRALRHADPTRRGSTLHGLR